MHTHADLLIPHHWTSLHKVYADPGFRPPYPAGTNHDEYVAALLNFQGRLPDRPSADQPDAVYNAAAWHAANAFTADYAYVGALVDLMNAGQTPVNVSIEVLDHITPDVLHWAEARIIGHHDLTHF